MRCSTARCDTVALQPTERGAPIGGQRHTCPMPFGRHIAHIMVGALALVTLAACGSTSTGNESSASSPASSAAPSVSHSPKAAVASSLPTSFEGWSTTATPTPAPTTIGASKATMTTAIYRNAAGDGTLIATLVVTDDQGYADAQAKLLEDSHSTELGICGTPTGTDNSVSCVLELSGGLLQTTATGGDLDSLAAFSGSLYTALP